MKTMIECLIEFESWPVEYRSACVFEFERRKPAPIEVKHCVAKPRRNENLFKPYTDDDVFVILESVEKHGANVAAWRRASKSLGRSKEAIAEKYRQIQLGTGK